MHLSEPELSSGRVRKSLCGHAIYKATAVGTRKPDLCQICANRFDRKYPHDDWTKTTRDSSRFAIEMPKDDLARTLIDARTIEPADAKSRGKKVKEAWRDHEVKISEVFYSIHGEGALSGTPSLFVRLPECNLRCSKDGKEGFDCDTDFESSKTWTLSELVSTLEEIAPGCQWLTLTGGEPTLKLDELLVAAMASRWKLALETNGTIDLDDLLLNAISWVTVSPKTAWHTIRIRHCDELRLVRHHGQALPALLEDKFAGAKLYVSPVFDSDPFATRKNIKWCYDLCLDYPAWSLSVQVHKLLEVR